MTSLLPSVSFDLEGEGSVVRETAVLNTAPRSPMFAEKQVPRGNAWAVGEKLLRPRDFQCHDKLQNPGRPKILGQLLDGMSESLDVNETKYKKFVQSCESVVADAVAFDAMDVSCTLKYMKPASYNKYPESDDDTTSSMVYTFMFYASMQQAGGTSFQATELANETLSYYELDKFCRDFDIVPRLLTKVEVKSVWQDFIQIYVQTRGGAPLQALDFEQFKDMFVRLALYAYNKVGMKRMILAVTGFFPSAEDIINSLCEYCDFHDFNTIQAKIRSVGRETQGAINFKSSDDTSNRARAEIRIDLRAKFLARISAKENKEKVNKEKKRLQPVSDDNSDGSSNKSKDAAKTVQYGMWSGTSGKKYLEGRGMFNFNQRKSTLKSNLPDFLLKMLDGEVPDDASVGGDVSVGGIGREGSLNDSIAGGSSTNASLSQELAQTIPSEELMTYDKATAMAKARGTRLDLIADMYDKALIDHLGKYSRMDPPPPKAGVVESDGPYMDTGHLPPSTACSLVVTVTNLTLDILHLDITAEGFDDPNTHVIINPNPVVSGVQRQGQVKFALPLESKSQIAFVNIAAVTASGMRHTMRCPVFYRSDSSSVNRTILNRKTLSKMTELYLGRKFHPTSNFSKSKINGEVAWVRPVSASTLRRSVQELRPNSSRARSAISALSGTGRISNPKNRVGSAAVHTSNRKKNETKSNQHK